MSPHRFRKPCLECGVLMRNPSRCDDCAALYARTADHQRDKGKRSLYKGNYRVRAKQIRDTAEQCWLCGQGAIPGDPWQADHVTPDDPDSLLAPAHRSCNIRRALELRNKSKDGRNKTEGGVE